MNVSVNEKQDCVLYSQDSFYFDKSFVLREGCDLLMLQKSVLKTNIHFAPLLEFVSAFLFEADECDLSVLECIVVTFIYCYFFYLNEEEQMESDSSSYCNQTFTQPCLFQHEWGDVGVTQVAKYRNTAIVYVSVAVIVFASISFD